MSLNACGFFRFYTIHRQESPGQDNPILLFSPIHSKTILQHQLTASTFSPAYLVRKHHISKNQKPEEERGRLKIRTLHITIYYMPLLYISPCVLQKTVDIYTLVPSSLLDRKKIYINSPCTNANIYIEIINNIIHF